ncbi:VOC family protein [Pseudooctadecabacter jejudonensis]|uniref:Glyoxalase-like domain protein n=1 Tax=Pseudooctadecabacter jejudonensis TaxID=1391910 RepID=A0A1Y5T633_9RHOB|nr:VOC family protein [Pseudooctadecabacter jejudonensis]SLN56173.1 Glyoxalase-like domain protein [Pseudooctadecabacter jejudonensis]
MQAYVVWTEIPVTDLKSSCDFYGSVFGWTMEITQMGPNDVAMFNAVTDDDEMVVGGHLYPGTPASSGSTIHIAVPDTAEAAARRCVAAGGQVMGPVIDIPQGRFQYATDPDGNSIALFETRPH